MRLFRVEGGAVTDRIEGAGIAALAMSPEATLAAALAPWRAAGDPGSVALCGMVGSRNGWVDVPYVNCPADVPRWLDGAARLTLDGITVTIMAGLACTRDTGAPDVMRGEETQIFGAIAADPALGRGRHRLVLPGTHSKWATIEDGRIVAFQTSLTGELFALLRAHSTLTRASGAAADPADEAAGFADGVARARDGVLLGALFEARSAQLRHDRSAGWAVGFLSGLLIGREIGEVAPSLEPGARVRLVGDPRLAALYEQALAAHGFPSHMLDGDACSLAGLNLLETRS